MSKLSQEFTSDDVHQNIHVHLVVPFFISRHFYRFGTFFGDFYKFFEVQMKFAVLYVALVGTCEGIGIHWNSPLMQHKESFVSFCSPKLKSGSIPSKNCTEFFIIFEESEKISENWYYVIPLLFFNLNLRIP